MNRVQQIVATPFRRTAHTRLALRHTLGGYREFAPPAALAGPCEAVWTHETPPSAPLPQGATHRVLPDPAISVAFVCRRGPDRRVDEARLVVIGPKTRPHVFVFHHGLELTAVKVKLEWAVPLLGLEPLDHQDASHDLSSVHPALADRLLGALAETPSAGEAARVLVAEMDDLVARDESRPRPTATRALDLVRASAGRLAVEEIAHCTGISLRHLRRTVRCDTGVSLKWYARTVRLLNAVTTADRTSEPSWARVAADAGYCDQSHLVRECRALCGLTPGEVDRERRAEAETSNRA